MDREQKTHQSGPAVDADRTHNRVEANTANKTPNTSSEQRSPLATRSSMGSIATTLPSYSEQLQSDQPPKYNDAGIYASRPNPSSMPQRRSMRNSQPFDAAAVNAVLATSSSNTDKMHSKPSGSRRVEDWNEDTTYKSRLTRMTGSSRKWNYFGADIGGNPFKRSGKR